MIEEEDYKNSDRFQTNNEYINSETAKIFEATLKEQNEIRMRMNKLK
jgi:hypothetical protein